MHWLIVITSLTSNFTLLSYLRYLRLVAKCSLIEANSAHNSLMANKRRKYRNEIGPISVALTSLYSIIIGPITLISN